jgi:hypothetical protein
VRKSQHDRENKEPTEGRPLAAAQRTCRAKPSRNHFRATLGLRPTVNERGCMLFDAQNRAIISKPGQRSPPAVVANIRASRNAGAQPDMTPDPCSLLALLSS